MSILSKLFSPRNEMSAPAAPAVVPTHAIMPSGRVTTLSVNTARLPGDTRTNDELHYGTEFFLPGITYSPRSRQFFCQKAPPASRELILDVAGDAKPLFSGGVASEIQELGRKLERSDQQLAENSYTRISTFLPVYLQSQLDSAIADGKQPPSLPSGEERLRATKHIREALHQRKNELINSAFTLMRPGIEKFSAAAWARAKAQEKQERGGLLSRLKIAFTPSPYLRSLVWLAIRSTEPIRAFAETPNIMPTADPLVIYGFLIPPEAAPVHDTMAENREATRDRAHAEQAEQAERESEARRKQVLELNKLHDLIRLKDPNLVESIPHTTPYRPPKAPGSHQPTPEAEPVSEAHKKRVAELSADNDKIRLQDMSTPIPPQPDKPAAS